MNGRSLDTPFNKLDYVHPILWFPVPALGQLYLQGLEFGKRFADDISLFDPGLAVKRCLDVREEVRETAGSRLEGEKPIDLKGPNVLEPISRDCGKEVESGVDIVGGEDGSGVEEGYGFGVAA